MRQPWSGRSPHRRPSTTSRRSRSSSTAIPSGGRSTAATSPTREEEKVEVKIAGIKVGETQAPDEEPVEQAHRRTAVETETKEDIVHIHLPNPSYYPLITALGLFVAALGLLIGEPVLSIGLLHLPALVPIGGIILALGAYGWSFEPAG